ncbi:hypothetical protein RFI_11237 [Reticulomyxa filosa]|uniref:Phosphagen kinase C-terminal domain-containing protein n=1 Tax=Reticulomyxa filosa TaxID=46433 RepID=X6NJL5_RETFI|nr:hypothetical protein RFI_11237 [Reticulomyxa filosa]|eukprot:ETO25899.1 hypothetical protein RFI_11237 [Reticulomyxa filosa]
MINSLRMVIKSKEIFFLYDNNLGWLTSSPAHLGTGLTISCELVLPKLLRNFLHKKCNENEMLCESLIQDHISNIIYPSRNTNSEIIQNVQVAEINFRENIIVIETLYTLGRTERQTILDLVFAAAEVVKAEFKS